jgi:ergothioneine biosynthesis protein EgtB
MPAIASGMEAANRFHAIRNRTMEICKPLQPDDFIVQPILEVSPPKWHLGHTTWFFETFLLKKFLAGYQEFHPQFSFIFNSYYESVGERVHRDKRGNLTRPALKEVMLYREYVDQSMAQMLESHGEELQEELSALLEIGLQHEQQHQELLITDIKYILGTNPMLPPYREDTIEKSGLAEIKVEYITLPEGLYHIGATGHETFTWDNELPRHPFYIQETAVRNTLVTAGEYLEFIRGGGYADFQYWLSEGWETVKSQNWQAPLYWHQAGDQWFQYDLGGLKEINESEPVTHISFYEAAAYASFAGKRLLTEQEWEAFATLNLQSGSFSGNFLESEIYHPTPPGLHNKTGNAWQLLGDCWEWTYSAYLPYPGYRQAAGALGEYNGKFMVNQMVLRGGSCATPQSHIRPTYRNFFHPASRWQFSGIRLAEISQPEKL